MPYLKNFRTNFFSLFGTIISIGGMAGPHNNIANFGSPEDPQGIKGTLNHLKKAHKMEVLIGMHEDEDYTVEAEEAGLEYFYIPVQDFADDIPFEVYDKIYEVVKNATRQRKEVTIHCGAGNGRTGAALVALKLREIIESECQKNPSIVDEEPEQNETVGIFGCVTPFVKSDLATF